MVYRHLKKLQKFGSSIFFLFISLTQLFEISGLISTFITAGQNEKEELNAESIACNMDTVYWKAGCLQNKAYHIIESKSLEFPITTKPKLLNVIVNKNDVE